jgi:hypothetical protein
MKKQRNVFKNMGKIMKGNSEVAGMKRLTFCEGVFPKNFGKKRDTPHRKIAQRFNFFCGENKKGVRFFLW